MKGLAAEYDQKRRVRDEGRGATIAMDLHLGEGTATAWGCDLTPEYVRLNSDYTT